MRRLYFLLILLVPFSQQAFTQFRISDHREQLWFQYFNQTRFSSKYALWFDTGIRTGDDFTKDISTVLARIGLIYSVNPKMRLAGGYAFFNQYTIGDRKGESQPEHRLWQQVQWQLRGRKIQYSHQVRLEERFRRNPAAIRQNGDDYFFNWRLRYNFGLQVPLGNGEKISWILNDELMVNFGNNIVYNHFDQNRFLTGFRFHFNPANSLVLAYMNIYQKLPGPENVLISNVVRISYFHNLNSLIGGN
jgi:hypothetical protein